MRYGNKVQYVNLFVCALNTYLIMKIFYFSDKFYFSCAILDNP